MSTPAKFVNFAKPFIDATKQIFESMVYTKLQHEAPSIKKEPITRGDVSAVVGITGICEDDGPAGDYEFNGQFVISFPMDSYIKVASAMLGEEYTEFSDEIADVGAEIANMILGNAKKDLTEQGYSIDMAIPTTISGLNHSIKYPPGAQIVIIPVTCDHGKFTMEVCYHDLK